MAQRKLITVYKGRNSPTTITVTLLGVNVNFLSTGVNKMSLVIDEIEYSSDKGFISYEDGGLVTFKLGEAESPPDEISVGRLIVYSDKYPLGKPILTEKTNFQLLFEFV